jgi:hypothetical protein
LIVGRRHLERVLRVYVRHYNGQATELTTEALPADALSHLDRNDVQIAKTASRRTLGYMNEMASELEWHITHDGGTDRAAIKELNHALRRMLRNRGGSDYARPIELVNQRLAAPEPPRTNI